MESHVDLELESATHDVSSTARPDATLPRRVIATECRFARALHDSGGIRTRRLTGWWSLTPPHVYVSRELSYWACFGDTNLTVRCTHKQRVQLHSTPSNCPKSRHQTNAMQRHVLTVVDAFSVFGAGEFTALFRVIVVIGVIRFRRWSHSSDAVG